MHYDSDDQDISNLSEHALDFLLEMLGTAQEMAANETPGQELRVSLRDAQTSAAFPITPGLSSTQHELNSLILFIAERQREQSRVRLSQCCTQSVCNAVKI